MGFCCSKPQVDEDEDEHTALLGEHAESIHEPQVPDRFANLSAEEIAQIREVERLKSLEQRTTDALINISTHQAGLTQGHGMGNSGNTSRDYTELLKRFNQEIRLPMVKLSGPAESSRAGSGGVDVASVLSEGRITKADAVLIEEAINCIIDTISTVYIDPPPGDCVVPLSIPSDDM
ncbi:hypothetical protein H4S08_004545 [Coemansia sp. RSA 1365]|nr:hypothetical protein H4S08_004545 [Coemansia sp. RSA 1365]